MKATRYTKHFDSRRLLIGLTGACLGLGATLGYAAGEGPDRQARSTIVQYGDLNLATPQGVQRLYQRIVAAAGQVCESRGQDRWQAIEDHHCRTRSISRAVAAVDYPQLTALHAAKTGQPQERLARR
ncbi:MAG: UrcA family protein [Proteobacteria bacterium]|nr:UrcA family protein [Pseudomonadota bacterium]